MRALLAAITVTLALPAAAGPMVPDDNIEVAAFLRAIDEMAPSWGVVFRDVADSYKRRCNRAMTVADYRSIGMNSTSAAYMLAVLSMTDARSSTELRGNVLTNYKDQANAVPCDLSRLEK